jgi:hypothetical protein
MTDRKLAKADVIRTEEEIEAEYGGELGKREEELRAKCDPILKELFDACTGNYNRPDFVLRKVLNQVIAYAVKQPWRPDEIIQTVEAWTEDYIEEHPELW